MFSSAQTSVEIPTRWFNAIPQLPEALPPPLDPEGDGDSRVQRMRRIRPRALVAQDALKAGWENIPDEVLARYQEIGRPTPLTRARALERYLGTPARIYIKREDSLPTGSFKLNSAIAQVHLAHQEGWTRVVSETGAGQWGHALAYACRLYGMECVVFWARVSERQKKYRSALTRMLGATVYPSPGPVTPLGRRALEADPGDLGSLGTAIGEAIAYATEHSGFAYLSGSNLPHVLMHQTVIGLETELQLAELGEEPRVLVACVGGGGNLGGFMLPFLPQKRENPLATRWIAAEAESAPRLTRGQWRYDHADPLGITPLTMSYTLGRDYHLPETHVGGLRQHSGSTVVGLLYKHGLLEARAYSEREVFEAGRLLIHLEGIVPAPESCHALRATIECALEAKREGCAWPIVMCLSGNGSLDLGGYIDVLNLE